jgi:hypothetical protein
MIRSHKSPMGFLSRRTGMKRFAGMAVLGTCLLFVRGTPALDKRATFTTIDVPGAGTGSGQGTVPSSINSARAVTGSYKDAGGVVHGFVRAADGTISTFDAPEAAKRLGEGTLAVSINA